VTVIKKFLAVYETLKLTNAITAVNPETHPGPTESSLRSHVYKNCTRRSSCIKINKDLVQVASLFYWNDSWAI